MPAPETRAERVPSHMRLLFLHDPQSPPDWLQHVLHDHFSVPPHVIPCRSLSEALKELREDAIHAVLFDQEVNPTGWSNALSAIRAGTTPFQPVIVLCETCDPALAQETLACGADAILPRQQTSPAELAWQIRRCIERAHLIFENEQLRRQQKQLARSEVNDFLRVIDEQAALLHVTPSAPSEHNWLVHELHDLLTSYVLMGTGELSNELDRLAMRLAQQNVSARDLIGHFHHVLRQLLREMGTRSARHVFHRGQTLLLQLLLHGGRQVAADAVLSP